MQNNVPYSIYFGNLLLYSSKNESFNYFAVLYKEYEKFKNLRISCCRGNI